VREVAPQERDQQGLRAVVLAVVRYPHRAHVNRQLAPTARQVLAAHHGSDTSTTEAFVAAASPALAVISVGADNRFGHPSPTVLARLAAAVVRRTDTDGTVEIASDGRDLWVR